MWLWTLAAQAVAPAPVPPAAGLPPTLFERAALFEVKASSEKPTCEAALDALVARAMELGAKEGLKTIVGFYPAEGLAQPPLTHVPCKLTGIPDAPSGATTSALVLMIKPGYGFPNVSAQRQAELIGLLTAVHQVRPEALGLVYEDGQVWVNTGIRDHDAILSSKLGLNARAVSMLNTHVVPWVGRWAPVATQAPEVAGAVIGIRVRSEAEKGKRKEVFTYRADAATAAAFTVGRISEEDWMARLPVTVEEEGQKGKPRPIALDPDGASGSVTATGRQLGDLSDIPDE